MSGFVTKADGVSDIGHIGKAGIFWDTTVCNFGTVIEQREVDRFVRKKAPLRATFSG